MHFREREIGMALNMVLNLRKLTFEHFLLLTLDEASCQHVLQAFPKAGERTVSAGCAWLWQSGVCLPGADHQRSSICKAVAVSHHRQLRRSSCQQTVYLPKEHISLHITSKPLPFPSASSTMSLGQAASICM